MHTQRRDMWIAAGFGGTALLLMVVVMMVVVMMGRGSQSRELMAPTADTSDTVEKEPVKNNTRPQQAQRKTQRRKRPRVPPAIECNACQILDDYHANTLAADKVYRDKLLVVEGVVQSVGVGFGGSPYVMIRCARDIRSLQAATKTREELLELRPGDLIRIRGIGIGTTLSIVQIKDCTVIGHAPAGR